MKKLTTEAFITLANKKHKNFYDYTKSVYTNSRKSLTITCPIHGDFTQKANNHTNGAGCTKCKIVIIKKSKSLTLFQFIKKAKIVHKNKYDYSKVIYKNNRTFVIIICPIHGQFSQIPDSHLQGTGCKKCGYTKSAKSNTLSTALFIKKSNEMHSYKYCYDGSIYLGNKSPITILCKKHGYFTQTAGNHKTGSGCPNCKIDNVGWTYTKWYKKSLLSKNFDGYKLYIIKCWNTKESFYKIGRTFTKVKYRFSGINAMPYNYEIIKIIKDNPYKIFKLEIKMKKDNKKNSYTPLLYFPGKNECFSKINSL